MKAEGVGTLGQARSVGKREDKRRVFFLRHCLIKPNTVYANFLNIKRIEIFDMIKAQNGILCTHGHVTAPKPFHTYK